MHLSTSSKDKSWILRTVPVILRHKDRHCHVVAMLDDASTTSYLTASIAAELGCEGQPQQANMAVLNGETVSLDSTLVTFNVESLNGQTVHEATALTTPRVTRDVEVINWNDKARQWEHLKGLTFPSLPAKPRIELLIGLDMADLHYSLHDIRGNPGEPITRLTPLGWTSIGPSPTIDNPELTVHHSLSLHCHNIHAADGIIDTLRKFWEIERVPSDKQPMCAEEQQVLQGR